MITESSENVNGTELLKNSLTRSSTLYVSVVLYSPDFSTHRID